MSCNGVCQRYKAKKPKGISRYESGQKRCNICGVFMKWEGLYCPCCNMRIRVSSRYSKLKEKHLKIQRI